MVQKLAAIVCRRSKIILAAAVVLTIVCTILASRLKSRMELSILFNKDNQVLRDFDYITENFGGGDFLILVVKTVGTANAEPPDPGNPKAQSDSEDHESDDEIAAKSCQVLHDRLSKLDDISFVQIIKPWQIASAPKKGSLVGEKGAGKIAAILLAKPIHPPTDYKFCRRVSSEVDGVIADCLKRLESISSVRARPPLRVQLTGSYKIVVENQDTINRDLRRSAIIAFVGIFILNVIAFRSVRLPVLASVPLLMAIAWTMAVMYLTFGYVNMVTAVFPTVILGIGIDYAIHILSGFRESVAREEGAAAPGTLNDVSTRIIGVYRKISVALFIGAITTSVAFFALMTAKLNGFSQMGFMGGVGVLLSFIATFLVLPSLLVEFSHSDDKRAAGGKYLAGRLNPSLRSMAGLLRSFPERLQGSRAIRNIVLIGFAVVSLAALYFCSQIGYEVDPRKIQDPENPSLRLQDELIEKLGLSFNSIMVVSDSTIEERKLMDLCRRKYIGEGKVFRSADSLTLHFDLNVPTSDTKMYVGKDKKLLAYLYASGNAYNEQQLARIVSTVEEMEAHPDFKGKIITGSPLLYDELIQTLKHDLRRSTFFSFLGVAAVLLIGFRNVRDTLLALVPVGLGVVWMLGGMELAGINFTMINAIVTPLIVGIGIDDGVHIIQRYKDEAGDVPAVLRSAGRAIVTTSLTTMIGFGSLLTARHLGFFNMGISAVIGIGACLIISVLLLPALLSKLHRKSVNEV